MPKKSIHKAQKATVRKKFIEQGGQDGRYNTKVVPSKKKQVKKPKYPKKDIAEEINNE